MKMLLHIQKSAERTTDYEKVSLYGTTKPMKQKSLLAVAD